MAAPISFDQVPSNWRMPLFWAEVDPSMAGLPIVRQIMLLVGSMIVEPDPVGPPPDPALPAGVIPGTATPNQPKPVGTQAEADRQFGRGSELACIYRAAMANNFAQETWCLPVAPAPGSVAAAGTIKVLTAPTEAGMFHLYIAGHHVDSIVVGTTDTVDQIATIIAARINEDTTLPVVATAATDTVTVTAKTRGVNGNDITMQANYYGKVGGEVMPPGFTIEMPPLLGWTATHPLFDVDVAPADAGGVKGAGVPDFDDAISALGEHEYEYVCLPYTDSNTLFDFEQEWGFEDTGRWGWMRQLYGHIFCAKRESYSNLIIFGETRNNGIVSIMGVEPRAASPAYEFAAAYTAKAARALTNDPARPLQTLSLNRILPAKPEDRWILPELNSLSGVGIATQRTGLDGVIRIMRETTTYQLNLYGYSDDAYELVTTLATLARIIRNQRQVITSKFPRHKLGNDGIRVGPGQKIVTPKIIKAELVAQYRIDEFNGLVEDVTAFKEHLIVDRDPNNPNRLNVLWPPDLVNQLRIYAVLVQFRLQYNRGQDQEIIR